MPPRLSDFPKLGLSEELLGLASLSCKSYRLVYEIVPEQNIVWILALVHGTHHGLKQVMRNFPEKLKKDLRSACESFCTSSLGSHYVSHLMGCKRLGDLLRCQRGRNHNFRCWR
ncbi:MAG: type II toxin-antitoxin system RelE/ParE family toxin [Xanthomonadales bacterium]|nr:type II toxin-antitoxin system RelE/ParE family toxin [Xanthomonadales bacterium]